MSEQKDGGPAFPKAGLDNWEKAKSVQIGMSLRDYFAAQADIPWEAVIEILANKDNQRPTVSDVVNMRAAMKYLEADAMLKARGQ